MTTKLGDARDLGCRRLGRIEIDDVAALPPRREFVKRGCQFGVACQRGCQFVRKFELGVLFGRLDTLLGVLHGFFEIRVDCWCQPSDVSRAGEANHIGVARVWALFFQDAFGVLHECSIEERQSKVFAQSTEENQVAFSVHVTGMAPFGGFNQLQVGADLAQRRQPCFPRACRASRRCKAVAAPATFGKEVIDDRDHHYNVTEIHDCDAVLGLADGRRIQRADTRKQVQDGSVKFRAMQPTQAAEQARRRGEPPPPRRTSACRVRKSRGVLGTFQSRSAASQRQKPRQVWPAHRR